MGGSIVGVQNTALSIFVFAGFYRAIRGKHHFAAGLIASLLLYKPQFGALLLLFLIGRWRRAELLGWSLGALALYLAGTAVLGIEWPLVWLQEAKRFGDINFTINGQNMISLVGIIFWFSGAWLGDATAALAWGYGISVALLLASAWSIRDDESLLILAPYLVLFLSPQTLFYDLGIAAFTLLYSLRAGASRDFLFLATLWLYGSAAMVLRDTTSFPSFTIPLLVMAWVHYLRVRDGEDTGSVGARY
jgi:hypothetical protein